MEFDPETHTIRCNGSRIWTVTQILKSAGLINPEKYGQGGKERGTAGHMGCQFLDEGDLDWDSLDPVVRPYVESYRLWREATDYEWVAIEKPMVDDELQYAGIPDRVNPAFVMDLKTGGVEPWHSIQISAYVALAEKPPFTAPGYQMEGLLLYLDRDGGTAIERWFTKRQIRWGNSVFQAALTVHNWKRRNGGVNE